MLMAIVLHNSIAHPYIVVSTDCKTTQVRRDFTEVATPQDRMYGQRFDLIVLDFRKYDYNAEMDREETEGFSFTKMCVI